MKIRSYLLVFALAILLPLGALATLAIVAYDRQQRAAVERGGIETARALRSAVDRELARAITTLQVLAMAHSLERDDLAAFDRDARRVLASQSDWVTIILIGPSGQLLIDTYFPFGTRLPEILERPSFEEVLRTRRATVGPVSFGQIIGRFAFPVRVPVVRDGAVAYVLTGVIELTAVDEVLRRQSIPADWIGTAFDSRRVVVARTRNPFLSEEVTA